ncbi:helix-turn-helix domain-containing protein [Tenacibaculum sp. 190524A02b]|uniref:helix-turn-helix domain-containing protein n=1 Tax=Tenacibaculum vairaonense TaxID=3137860 RepID=UPI0031FA82A7
MVGDLKNEREALVLDAFLSDENNTVPAISKKLGFDERTVSRVINKYIKNLTINE